MLQELLFALDGFPGALFVWNGNRIKVTPVADGLQISETAQLDELCETASYCYRLREFVETQGFTRGQYWSAVSDSINVILTRYEAVLAELERDILANKCLGLLEIKVRIAPQSTILETIDSLVCKAVQQELRGCALLSHFAAAPLVTAHAVKDTCDALHVLLLRQCSDFMFFDALIDDTKEFFVQKEQGDSSNFVLRPDLLPSCIGSTLAEKILFIGHYLKLFPELVQMERTDLARRVAASDISSVEEPVESARSLVAAELWEIVVQGAGLAEELLLVKDLFLLGRGELWLGWLEETRELLSRPAEARRDLTHELVLAADSLSLESRVSRFTVTLTASDVGAPGWRQVTADLRTEHPLNLVFTPEVKEKYASLFRFLLQLKYVHFELSEAFSTLQGRPTLTKFHLVRHNMAFVVSALQNYIQVTVLETSYRKFRSQVSSERDFVAILHAHDAFLNEVQAQVFLWSKQMHLNILGMFDACLSFCQLVAHLDVVAEPFAKLQTNTDHWNEQLFLFLTQISQRQLMRSGPQLSQLLLQLNFNDNLFSSATAAHST